MREVFRVIEGLKTYISPTTCQADPRQLFALQKMQDEDIGLHQSSQCEGSLCKNKCLTKDVVRATEAALEPRSQPREGGDQEYRERTLVYEQRLF
jgi:hypothetical protein